MRRREFIAAVGGLPFLPSVARSQKPISVVGFLNIRSPGDSPHLVTAFQQGLRDAGYVDGTNVKIEYRWARGNVAMLPALSADLVQRNVSAIFASGNVTAAVAQTASHELPVVFISSIDPVSLGFVSSLNHPGGNMTGVSQLTTGLGAKQLGLLRQAVPDATSIAVLVNPSNQNAVPFLQDIHPAAQALGWPVQELKASTEADFEAVFSTLSDKPGIALLISEDAFFTGRSAKLAAMATGNNLPAMFVYREFPMAGGLMSYGTSITDAYRQCGIYVGRILNGERPGDLPVLQATKFELVINLKTANALGLTIPAPLLALADEVIE
jgi:putative ABC transport system substrate-binding protein